MTWWKRAEPAPAPTPGLSDLHRQLVDAQGDITLLYEQLERIHNRLKQRASRAAHAADDSRIDLSTSDDRPDFVAPLPAGEGTERRSSSLINLASDQPSLLTKDQVRELWRRRHQG